MGSEKHEQDVTPQAPVADAADGTENCSDKARALFHGVYCLVSRQDNPAIFYNDKGNSLPLPQSADDVPEERKALAAIEKIGISSGDTIKEINRLLDLASAKRIAEEMDIVTYHSNAARLFDRVKDEFIQSLKAFERDQESIDKKLTEIDQFRSPLKPAPAMQAPGNPDRSAADDKLLMEARQFLTRYRNFLDYARNYADRVGRDFYTEASVDAYKEATRPYAMRIEKTGLFAAYSALITGGLTGLVVAIALIVFDNNLVLKNWIIPTAAVAAIAAYAASVFFEKIRRNSFMSALRGTLYDSVLENPAELPGGGGNQPGLTRMDRILNTMKGKRSDQYFSFTKLPWKSFNEIPSKKYLRSKPLSSALERFVTTSSSRDSLTFLINATICLLFILLTLLPSLASGTLGHDKQFAFISRTAELGSCVLERGRVLLANGGSYFVETRHGNPVTEIDKSLVLRIEPLGPDETTANQGDAIAAQSDETAGQGGSQAKGARSTDAKGSAPQSKLPDCAAPRPEPKASDQAALVTATEKLSGSVTEGLASVAKQIGTGRDNPVPPDLVGATRDLAGNVEKGLGAIADKLGKGTGQDDASPLARLVGATGSLAANIKEGAGRITSSQAPAAPIVVPIIIDAPPAQAGAPAAQAGGPTFITQVYTADGKVYDYGSGAMMLPIFLDPVTSNDDKAFWEGGIDTEAKAFYFGLTSLTNQKLSNSATKQALLHEIAARYNDCMDRAKAAFDKTGNGAGTPRLKLRIEGYASEKWDGVNDGTKKQDLNLYLAEGRRAAIIQALGIDNPLIDIDSKPKPTKFSDWRNVRADEVSRNFLFKDYGAMETSLARRLPPAEGDKTASIDILAHAAVISVDGDVPQECRPKGPGKA
ncbi:hypothetical protein B5V01_32820 [Mesorhizobium erdmanii]|uniref:Uncharacterized protein n=2 Tax=Mesorhizobium TaxID=68287 RepID=A0A3M9XH57_9HYPH|nr:MULTISPECIES: hypothetical protein [Mesorhizobium]RNJ47136.1 hypothetical protein DNR46_04615 [Mesorhizobium japonicum]RXT33860.1 hypothetical protein B5V01_32820 [Mesorhizobium erdmanii]